MTTRIELARRAAWTCALVCAVVLAWPAATRAQEIKIAVLNSERIFQAFPETFEAQKTFDRDLEGWTKDAADKKRELDDLRTQLDQQSRMLSTAKIEEKQSELNKKQAEYEQFVRDIWGPKGKVVQRNAELSEPVVRRMREIVERIAKEQGYTLILDTAQGNVVYANRNYDITDVVVEKLREQSAP